MTIRKPPPYQIVYGADRGTCVMCNDRPKILAGSRLHPRFGICDPCARKAVGLFDANASRIAKFLRDEDPLRPTRRTP